jgi:hypothetical protein
MIAEVLEFVTGLKDRRPITETVGDATYAVKSDRTLGEVIRPPAPIAKPTLALATLNGFVDAVKANVDEFAADGVVIHVESFSSVALISLKADDFGRRHVWLRAKHEEVNPFRFESFYDSPDDLLIALQGSFIPSDNLTNLLRLCSNLTAGSSVQTADDGFSQKVVVQEGGVTRGGVELPPRIALAPYRTFREIDPVESDFLIRMRGKKDALPQIALYGVDGGGWKLDTVLAVKFWLQASLPDVTVIA